MKGPVTDHRIKQAIMDNKKNCFRNLIFLASLLLAWSCSAGVSKEGIKLVGSTPGDAPVKAMLGIPASTVVDFIRWDLQLHDNNTFKLQVVFGESQPNTLGFKGGGAQRSYEGTYTTTADRRFAGIVRMTSSSLPAGMQLAKLNAHQFHLLGPDQQLIIGNGGWSYGLNREAPIAQEEVPFNTSPSIDPSQSLVFEGRTPCQEIAGEHPEMTVSPSCFKLKWLLTLHKDAASGKPTTYQIRKVVNGSAREVTGTWMIRTGTPANPNAVVYALQTDKPGETIFLQSINDQILLFLNAQGQPFPGNKDFSYILNRRLK